MITFQREILSGPDGSGQSNFEVEIRFSAPLDTLNRVELERLLAAWYHVGACGGYPGVLLNQLTFQEFDREVVRFGIVIGGDAAESLQVLEWCLKDETNDLPPVLSATTRGATHQ